MDCPITPAELIGAMLAGQFERMSETEIASFAGEGQGWLWTRPDDVIVAADQLADQIVFNVLGVDGSDWLVVAALGAPRLITEAAA